jgi:hypothetical protein
MQLPFASLQRVSSQFASYVYVHLDPRRGGIGAAKRFVLDVDYSLLENPTWIKER